MKDFGNSWPVEAKTKGGKMIKGKEQVERAAEEAFDLLNSDKRRA
jgi:hypothetical protein